MKPDDVTHTEGEPHDRMTRLANEVIEAVTKHPEYEEGVRVMVFTNFEGRAGIGIHGYDEDGQTALVEATTDLIIHLTAMFSAMGKELKLIPVVQGDPRLQ